eukprot:Hpha_TRINITY_DN15933_c3_g5::TRINITY_DN15933_c3_g5_i1::g.72937::m.72937/K00387/SUOX; sulfite oxidase
MNALRPTRSRGYGAEAPVSGSWTGVLVEDVLRKVGELGGGGFLEASSASGFCVSVPLQLLRERRGLLAWALDGCELSAESGGPVRLVVPGVCGGRWVKGVVSLAVRSAECRSHWQQHTLRAEGPGESGPRAPAIYDMPVTSAILSPSPDTLLQLGEKRVLVSGYAYGGRSVGRVDVSMDGGFSWQQATLAPGQEPWCCVRWQARVVLPPSNITGAAHELCCKVVGESGNTQPETVRSTWNAAGVLNNAWHKVALVPHPEDAPPSVAVSLAAGDLDDEPEEYGPVKTVLLPLTLSKL